MRVLYHHRSLADGAEGVHITEVVKALRHLGHEVELDSLIGDRANEESRRGRRLGRLKAALPRFLFELAEIGYTAVAGPRLALRARRLGADLVYERYACGNLAGLLASRVAGIPLLLEVNSPLVLERQEHEGGLAMPRLLGRIERFVFRKADRCLVVSTPLARHLVQYGAPPAAVEVLPNGADPRRFDPADRGNAVRERFDLGDSLVVGFSGMVRPWHGLDLLARAVAGVNSPRLLVLVIGEGPGVPPMMAVARGLGIADRIRVTGRVPHGRVPEHLAACDITVSPRATFYASPLKIPEYMAAGRAVVAPRMPNIEDLVEHRRTGLLFEPESADSLGRRLAQLATDPEFRTRLAAAARREVETRLNWQRNAERIATLAAELRARRRPLEQQDRR